MATPEAAPGVVSEGKKPPELSILDAIRQSAPLEDCTDQLTILGCIMPVSYEGRKDISDLDEQELKAILGKQKELSTKYKNLMEARAESQAKVPIELGRITELGRQLEDTSSDLKKSNHLFSLATKQSSLSSDNLKKLQADREMMGRKKVKSLQKQLSDIKREKDYELQNRNEMVAYLKDQLQEMKAKTEMENRYVKKDRGLQVAQVQKKCAGAETDLLNEIEKLRNQIDQEMRVHSDIENFLKQQQVSIEEKLEYWVDKYEKETEAKQQELNALKSSRAADQAALQELARQCLACEQAIIEDRKEKENARKKVERDALEMKSILKLQAWWKGMMVRRFLGPYKALKKLFEEEQPVNEKGKKGKGKPGPKKKK
ncbi:dynein regulatory complex protein 9 isoform X3 [Sceloporus undulatus]|uniref:dynein regulatory complex protein 9 isoform X3 n=1 Tax=Sceloporus undulatus TaxID=8520 RepID=UPI001C4BD028|nr:dynein regulatory complex protein 9 isoform X3 [Sceloporus undulatus]